MADQGIEDFNAMGVSAPVPGEASHYDPPNDQQAEMVVPQPSAPEVPAEPLPEPHQIIDNFVGQQAAAEKKQSFAQLKFAAEQQEKARKSQAEAEIQRLEGLAELGRILETNPEFAQQVGGLYQQHFSGDQQAVPSTYSRPQGQPVAPVQTSEEMVAIRQQLANTNRLLMQYGAKAASQAVQGRHHLTQEDLSVVLATAVSKGYLAPGQDQNLMEERIEDAMKIAFFGRAKATGKQELLDKVAVAQKAVTAQGAAGGAVERKPYDTTGRTFAEVRRDAKLAGARGL